jgi:hypothetical protein
MYVYVCVCVFGLVVNLFLFELFYGCLFSLDWFCTAFTARVMDPLPRYVCCSKCLKMRRSGIKTPELEGAVLEWGKLPHSRCKLSGDLAVIRWDFACENRRFAVAWG